MIRNIFTIPVFLLRAGLLAIVIVAFWIWAVVDCIKSRLLTEQKLVWIVVILGLNLIGELLYFLLAKSIKVKPSGKLRRNKKNKIL